MKIGIAISLALLYLIYLFERGTDFANFRHRFSLSIVMMLSSGATIYPLETESLDSEVSMLLVSVFLVGGVYFVYTARNWMVNRNR